MRQVNLEVRQKEQECRVTPDGDGPQSQEQRQHEQPQGPLTRLLESVRGVLPKPVRTPSSEATAPASSQAASQIPDAEVAQGQGSEHSGIQTV